MTPESIQAEARRLRAEIYGEVSDQTWLTVRSNWIASLDWLRARVRENRAHPEWTIINKPYPSVPLCQNPN